jgi:hypothetical protein
VELPTWMTPTKKIPENRQTELNRMCASWATLAPHVKSLSRDESLYILRKEFQERTPPRPEFVGRLFFRVVRTNRDEMWKQLQTISPGCGYRARAGKPVRA